MAVSKIKSNAWKLVGTATGTTAITLPEHFSELWLQVTPSATGMNWFRVLTVPRISLLDTTTAFYTGDYAMNGRGAQACVQISKSKAFIDTVYDSGNNVTAQSALLVYAK